MQICPLCNGQSPDNDEYCSKCGFSLAGETGKLSPQTILEERYVIVRTLGLGGMGAVYQALDQRLNNLPVAIKEMGTNTVTPGNLHAAIEAFKKEASMLINLRHPALPRISDFFSLGKSRWYLVMDYIRGETLDTIAEQRGPIPESTVIDWAKQLCAILDYLHSQKPPVIFRDLKPSNIMLTPEGTIKLIDFGIARHFNKNSGVDTINYGSHGFASPEQYGLSRTDIRSDIYSLGATLHYLLTGVNPSKNPFTFEAPGKIVSVSHSLESAIMKALALKSEYRPDSAKDMLALLNRKDENKINGTEALIISQSRQLMNETEEFKEVPAHIENRIINTKVQAVEPLKENKPVRQINKLNWLPIITSILLLFVTSLYGAKLLWGSSTKAEPGDNPTEVVESQNQLQPQTQQQQIQPQLPVQTQTPVQPQIPAQPQPQPQSQPTPATNNLDGSTWMIDPHSGAKVWNCEPKAGESIRWFGPISNGFANGTGRLEWYRNGKFHHQTEGTWQNGKLEDGTIAVSYYPDGTFKEGIVVNGVIHFNN